MTKEELTKLCAESFNEGQIAGIELACNLLAQSIEQFGKHMREQFESGVWNKNET